MNRQSATAINQLYREFARQKFNSLRLKYPKLKESQITRKVLKEWEGLDSKAKKELENQYKKKNILRGDGGDSEDVQEKRKSLAQRTRGVQKNQLPIIPEGKEGGRIWVEDSSAEIPSSKSVKASDSGRQSRQSYPKIRRSRRIKKDIKELPNAQYLQFYKFYSGRLTKEHPKWNPNQRTTVIKLLWKKRKNQKKREAINKKQTHQIRKPAKLVKLTGYTFFVQQKFDQNQGVNPKDLRRQARLAWMRLNRSGKYFYEKKAKQYNEENGIREGISGGKIKKGADILAIMKLAI